MSAPETHLLTYKELAEACALWLVKKGRMTPGKNVTAYVTVSAGPRPGELVTEVKVERE